jgi:Mor family transcriptional regulator
VEAIQYGMLLLYIGQKLPHFPLSDHTPRQYERNHEIQSRYANGETIIDLATNFGISQQRVSQIVRGQRK